MSDLEISKTARPTSYEYTDTHKTTISSDTEAQVVAGDLKTFEGAGEPSAYRRVLNAIREPMAEFFGVALLVIFGAGAGCTTVLSADPNIAASSKGTFFSINFGWAIGIAIGVWVSAGISGGHINPAVTLAMATHRKFPWRKVPGYIFAQVLGGLVGAGLIYALYFRAIDIFEGPGIRTQASAGIFVTYSLPYMTAPASFFTEFLATGILSMALLAMTDKRNAGPPAGLLPLALFLLFVGFGVSLGMQTAYALNPARDFGPRLFLSMAGYGKQLYTYRHQYWLWCPIIAPIVGAQAGAFLYDLFLYTGQGYLNPSSRY